MTRFFLKCSGNNHLPDQINPLKHGNKHIGMVGFNSWSSNQSDLSQLSCLSNLVHKNHKEIIVKICFFNDSHTN